MTSGICFLHIQWLFYKTVPQRLIPCWMAAREDECWEAEGLLCTSAPRLDLAEVAHRHCASRGCWTGQHLTEKRQQTDTAQDRAGWGSVCFPLRGLRKHSLQSHQEEQKTVPWETEEVKLWLHKNSNKSQTGPREVNTHPVTGIGGRECSHSPFRPGSANKSSSQWDATWGNSSVSSQLFILQI